ncbi:MULTISPECIES: fumarylacetoacetate hydrolase family protein [unclassified Chelatococcus]|uniref:2-keto-4-pentenoate hydratase n=1 Tax=unclassified Chelatococcus TaxID=2638111 RepID=UPI001BCB65B2|nr:MULTISPECIES: fumarylacetoacetate hydrolase family protein [unclassified Chelatococcus]CAH1656520.1 2-keto-4-pentenoate hydratase [Hyphomicrobiales bacterium]MBS7740546.1 fumarylacetoacetate hydrolase family protein [Chelatococcus sp. HY11]MBX3544670.1 fumarylacetoacetate hydrolase family protein [Chelatococcus sp.]MCO5078211.1 fumarylacetoacetate hydrolase family protein [Chelatococcus sp.]CAH1684716.1 2-keto-4-pentenoate hydratase [Hyphomicrobiales bacterium]
MSEPSAVTAIALAFANARAEARALSGFPGTVPESFEAAYAVQKAAMGVHPANLRGWKVAMVRPDWRAAFPEERLIGPVYHVIDVPDGGTATMPSITGGYTAAEAEFIAVMAQDLPPREKPYEVAEVAAAISAIHVGAEIAGSPLVNLNDLGPGSIISDFGCNAGVVLGPEVVGWQSRPWESLTAKSTVNGAAVGEGTAAGVPGTPLAAVVFLANRLSRLKITLRAGDLVSTGMVTGIHKVAAGDRAVIDFSDCGQFTIDFATAKPVD